MIPKSSRKCGYRKLGITTTLTEGAIGYANDTRKGYQIMGVIRLADGSHPPLGISVNRKPAIKN
ncbi:hypothetical protein ACLBR5_07335 [Escherichia coli]